MIKLGKSVDKEIEQQTCTRTDELHGICLLPFLKWDRR